MTKLTPLKRFMKVQEMTVERLDLVQKNRKLSSEIKSNGQKIHMLQEKIDELIILHE